jgi:hypothetical protein
MADTTPTPEPPPPEVGTSLKAAMSNVVDGLVATEPATLPDPITAEMFAQIGRALAGGAEPVKPLTEEQVRVIISGAITIRLAPYRALLADIKKSITANFPDIK